MLPSQIVPIGCNCRSMARVNNKKKKELKFKLHSKNVQPLKSRTVLIEFKSKPALISTEDDNKNLEWLFIIHRISLFLILSASAPKKKKNLIR